jgi:hypothetical protein
MREVSEHLATVLRKTGTVTFDGEVDPYLWGLLVLPSEEYSLSFLTRD